MILFWFTPQHPYHFDATTWKRFSGNWPFRRGIHWLSPFTQQNKQMSWCTMLYFHLFYLYTYILILAIDQISNMNYVNYIIHQVVRSCIPMQIVLCSQVAFLTITKRILKVTIS